VSEARLVSRVSLQLSFGSGVWSVQEKEVVEDEKGQEEVEESLRLCQQVSTSVSERRERGYRAMGSVGSRYRDQQE
jgi:hypothetical protein